MKVDNEAMVDYVAEHIRLRDLVRELRQCLVERRITPRDLPGDLADRLLAESAL